MYFYFFFRFVWYIVKVSGFGGFGKRDSVWVIRVIGEVVLAGAR